MLSVALCVRAFRGVFPHNHSVWTDNATNGSNDSGGGGGGESGAHFDFPKYVNNFAIRLDLNPLKSTWNPMNHCPLSLSFFSRRMSHCRF